MKRRLLIVGLILIFSFLATGSSLKITRDYPLPDRFTYYNPAATSHNPINSVQIKPAYDGTICANAFASEITATSGSGWPVTYRYEVDSACSGAYITELPLAAVADFCFYVLVFCLLAWAGLKFIKTKQARLLFARVVISITLAVLTVMVVALIRGAGHSDVLFGWLDFSTGILLMLWLIAVLAIDFIWITYLLVLLARKLFHIEGSDNSPDFS